MSVACASSPSSVDCGANHDHHSCIETALARAETLCVERGARLTVLRRRVLELVWSGHQPRGAYQLLEELGHNGRAAAPLTVYRALAFLVEQGLVHRIESLNAYVGCPVPDAGHTGQFLVCDQCGVATEINDPRVTQAVRDSAEELGFRIQQTTVEIRGRCLRCHGGAPA
ncbi:Zinc uptake regulation protein [uncultured Gammaproteobacteria bacterium]